MNESEVSANWCGDDWLHGHGLEKQNKNEKICKEILMQSANTLQPVMIAKLGPEHSRFVPEQTPTKGLGKTGVPIARC